MRLGFMVFILLCFSTYSRLHSPLVEDLQYKMTKILSVATAGVFAEQSTDINHLRFPRVDYIELQRLLNLETIDYSAYDAGYAGKIFRHLETQLRSDIYIAMLGWWKSRNHQLVFAWSERAGIPLAAYKRLSRSNNRFVTMFQCSSDRQELAVTRFNLFPTMDEINLAARLSPAHGARRRARLPRAPRDPAHAA